MAFPDRCSALAPGCVQRRLKAAVSETSVLRPALAEAETAMAKREQQLEVRTPPKISVANATKPQEHEHHLQPLPPRSASHSTAGHLYRRPGPTTNFRNYPKLHSRCSSTSKATEKQK
eukprot:GHVT01079592.1.p2 GENE.GHVT01079592.1~~GHVT01079592.1.p2  ORF type:complete len:118 (-),score=24.30 GHVT01079592.1:532-885(-)